MNALTVNNMHFSYSDTVPVLHDISLTIGKGERWAIIGQNGSGKSTLIRCIARLETVTAGTIAIDGFDTTAFSPRTLAKHISYVPQASMQVAPPFTVLEFVRMGRYPYRGIFAGDKQEDYAIAREALELTDTLQFAARPMNRLSGGELQRVFIAGAVAQRTTIMLLDEPVSFLDPLHQEIINQTLDRIHNEFKTTLITITHDINAALGNNSHVAAMVNGKVLFSGTTGSFRDRSAELLQMVYTTGFESATGAESGRHFLFPIKREVT